MKLTFLNVLVFLALLSNAQSPDTIRVMHYNLLNYRNTTNQCTESTNNAEDKEGYLNTIVSHVKPDVLTVNEMGAHWLNPNKLLTNALNINGVTYFEQAEFSNNGFSSLANMLFYNNTKLSLYQQEVISKDKNGQDLVRVIDVYTLFYKDSRALNFGDTTFLTFVVAHLKAGSTSDDKNQRALMTEAVMAYLKQHKKNHAYLMNGDFNVQTSTEQSYKNLVEDGDVKIRFYDPVDASGSWNNNSNYANVHTQSTHISDTRGGCFSGGGMDDRFDFILCGNEVLDKSNRIHYIDGTYRALGQDSRRFNGEISSPLNTVVPHTVALALYEMSDHLPVVLDLEIQKKSLSAPSSTFNVSQLMVRYPMVNQITFDFNTVDVRQVMVIGLDGQVVEHQLNLGSKDHFDLSTQNLSSGIYFIYIQTTTDVSLFSTFFVPN